MPPSSPPGGPDTGEHGSYETPPRKDPLSSRRPSRPRSAGVSVPRGISNWQRQPKDSLSRNSHYGKSSSSSQHSNEVPAGQSKGESAPGGKGKRSLGPGMGMRGTPAKRSKWNDTRSMGAESTPRNAFLARLRGINDPPSSSSSGTWSSSLTWPSEPETAPTPSSSALMLSSPLSEISRIAPPDAYDSGSDVFGDRTFLPDVAPDSQARYSLEYQAARLRGYDEREADWLESQAQAQQESTFRGVGGEGSQPSRPVSVTGGMAWDEEVAMPSTSDTQQSSEAFSDDPAFATPTKQATISPPPEGSTALDKDTPTQVHRSWSNGRTVEDSMVYEDEIIPLGTLAQYVKSRSASRSQSTSQGMRGSSSRSSNVSTPHLKRLSRDPSPGTTPTTPRQGRKPLDADRIYRPASHDDLEPGVPRNEGRQRTPGSRSSVAQSLPDHASAHIFGMDTSLDDSRDQELSDWEEGFARVDIGLEDLSIANAQDHQPGHMNSPLDRNTRSGLVVRVNSVRQPRTPAVPRRTPHGPARTVLVADTAATVVQRFRPSSQTSSSPRTPLLSPISFASTESSPSPCPGIPEVAIQSNPSRCRRPDPSYPDKPWLGAWKGGRMVARCKDHSNGPLRASTPFDDHGVQHRRSRRSTVCSSTYPIGEIKLTKEELQARLRRIEHYRDLELNYHFTVEYVAF